MTSERRQASARNAPTDSGSTLPGAPTLLPGAPATAPHVSAPAPASSGPHISRRQVLKLAALGLGAVALDAFLTACKARTFLPSLPPATPRPTPAPTATPTNVPSASTLASATPAPLPTSADVRYPDLVVAQNGDPEPLVRAAIAALGGMALFVPRGATVVVKPNICVSYRTYEYAATTNPWVVSTLVKMALEAGAASVKVFDYPFGGSFADAYATSGIGDQVKAAGGQMVVMSDRGFVTTRIPNGQWLKETDVYQEILNADVLINVPIAKEHGSARISAAMKNLMGIVADRPSMHGDLGQAIADLNTLVKPALNVLDCVRILTSGGPTGGSLSAVKKLDTVVAGHDIVAVDSYAATLFGLTADDIDYVRIGASMGRGSSDLSSLKIDRISV